MKDFFQINISLMVIFLLRKFLLPVLAEELKKHRVISICCTPLSPGRLLERGLNQVEGLLMQAFSLKIY